jgi:3-methylcrotonyl-CoA carboxylase alpha subunit
MQYRFQTSDQIYEVAIESHDDHHIAMVNGQAYDLQVLDAQPGELSFRFDKRLVTLYWADDGERLWLSLYGCTYLLEKPDSRSTRKAEQSATGDVVRAPMPAQVRAMLVSPGEVIEKGSTLLLLEAMKMEIRVKAPGTGRISRLLVTEGQAVEKDQLLVEIEKK